MGRYNGLILFVLTGLVGCGGHPDFGPAPDLASVEAIRTRLLAGSEESAETAVAEDDAEPAGYGTLRGRFVFAGDPPNAAPILVTKDQEVCGKHPLVDESFQVHASSKGISSIVLFVSVARGAKLPKPHASYADGANAEIRLDNANCRYEPHVVTLRTTQTLVVANRDSVGHNTKIDTVKNVPINPIIPAGDEIRQQFPQEERMPVKASCAIHPWMSGFVVIKETPYMAVTDENGQFAIENLPAGEWDFQVWQERLGPVTQVTVNGQPTTWPKGKLTAKIEVDSVTELDVQVAADALQ